MNERTNLIPVTEDEIRKHYGRISRGAIFIAKDDGAELFDAVEEYVRLRESRVVDPRIALIEALCDETDARLLDVAYGMVSTNVIRAILRGDA